MIKFFTPKYRAEANLQADFYHQCRTVGLHPYLEYSYQHCRFDCVIVDNGWIIAIVETKPSPKHGRNRQTERQLETYNYFSENTPIFLLTSNADIHKIIAKIQRIRKTLKKKKLPLPD